MNVPGFPEQSLLSYKNFQRPLLVWQRYPSHNGYSRIWKCTADPIASPYWTSRTPGKEKKETNLWHWFDFDITPLPIGCRACPHSSTKHRNLKRPIRVVKSRHSVILLCLTPDDFTCQRRASGWERVKVVETAFNCCTVNCSTWLFPFILGDKQLDGYQKKKYVCKLLFIFLLGHDIDFGHMEAVNLLSSNKYTEKQIVSFIRYL